MANLCTTIDGALEKISSREKYLNTHFAELVDDYKMIREKWARNRGRFDDVSVRVRDASTELANVSEALESVQVPEFICSARSWNPMLSVIQFTYILHYLIVTVVYLKLQCLIIQ